MIVKERVNEEVNRHPPVSWRHAVILQRTVEIGGAVCMAWIAHVVVIFLGAGHREGVVPPAGVLHNLDQWQHLLVVIFRVQTRHWIGVAHQRAGRCHVKRVLDAFVQFACAEAFKIGTLPPVHIDDLDIIARFYKERFGGLRMHPNV